MRRSSSVVVILLAAALGYSTPAAATTMQRLSLSELTYISDLVAEAEVETNVVERVEGGIHLRTVTTLRLTHVIKGELHVGERVDVRVLGGRLGAEETTMQSVPVYAPGERVLVFLERRGAEWGSVGLSQGKYTLIEETDTGYDVVVKVAPPRGTPTFDESVVTLPAKRLYASDFVAWIQQDLDAGYVPDYKEIAGLPPAKDAAYRAAARAAGRLDPRWDGVDR